ncbi:MAG: ATP-binding cassette domain-containing protein [Halioglobus sp.]|nr:ATP-binding cassette domain-containing protein [Halioglobus sp.]
MRLILSFFNAYRWPTALMLLALLLSGAAEGIGLSALLPLVNIALGPEATAILPGADVASQNKFERTVLDTLSSVGITPTLGNMLLIVLGGVAFKGIFLLIGQRQVGYTAAQVSTDLRLQLLRVVLRSKWEYFLHQPVGKLTNALASEAQRSSAAFINGATAITYLIQALIYGTVAFALSWQASMVGIGAGIIVIGLSHFLVRVTRRAGNKQTLLMTSLMSNLTDTLQSVKPLKAMAREHLADQVLAQDTNRLNKALRRQVMSAATLNSGQELMFTAFICLGVYVSIAQFEMDLPVVMVLVVALGRAFSFFGKVQKQYQKLVQGESAYWALLDSINAASDAEEHLGGSVRPQFAKAIDFNNVSFDYNDERHPVFTNLALKIKAGSLTTLVGSSGAGKTTIVDLTIGLLQPKRGNILIDGAPLQDIDLRLWRGMIGYVPQDTLLLHDSILHNVTLGDPKLNIDDAEQALRAANAWEFVSGLPEGLATIVGERGGKLSGGQRQRIVIARALVNRPSLLILDEATSALDRESEDTVCQSLEALKGKITILAISHNRAMVQAADYVYRMADGTAQLLPKEDQLVLAK